MGVIVDPEAEEFYSERARQESEKKRREYDEFLVSGVPLPDLTLFTLLKCFSHGIQGKGAQYRKDKAPLHEMGVVADEATQRYLAERARGEKMDKRQDYDAHLASEARPRTPNKEHLQEMGLLINPTSDDWYKEKDRIEKMQKRRDYDQYLVSVA